jgi:hypothetical protein
MESLALLLGHLVGDFIAQNDWMASRKWRETWPCIVHCLAYTASLALFGFLYFPWWVFVVAGLLHFPIDRWRLARAFMTLNGQEVFATGPLAPWSVVVVDNTMHLCILFWLGQIASS